MVTESESVLDCSHAAFMLNRASVLVASRGRDLMPNVVRALGCRVSPDRRRVAVFLNRPAAQGLLEDFADNRNISVVFTRPSTHQAMQVKGRDASVGAVGPQDLALIEAYREAMAAELAGIGYTAEFARALLSDASGDVVAVSFTPVEAYTQTPGPRAGTPLGRQP